MWFKRKISVESREEDYKKILDFVRWVSTITNEFCYYEFSFFVCSTGKLLVEYTIRFGDYPKIKTTNIDDMLEAIENYKKLIELTNKLKVENKKWRV